MHLFTTSESLQNCCASVALEFLPSTTTFCLFLCLQTHLMYYPQLLRRICSLMREKMYKRNYSFNPLQELTSKKMLNAYVTEAPGSSMLYTEKDCWCFPAPEWLWEWKKFVLFNPLHIIGVQYNSKLLHRSLTESPRSNWEQSNQNPTVPWANRNGSFWPGTQTTWLSHTERMLLYLASLRTGVSWWSVKPSGKQIDQHTD